MPPLSEPFLWNSNLESRLALVSPYDSKVASFLGLSIPNLASASSFHASLDATKRPPNLDYLCFVGTLQSTMNSVRFDLKNAACTKPSLVETEDAGDGTVPSWSASLIWAQQMLVAGDHGSLYKPREVLTTLGVLLGKPGVLAAMEESEAIRLSLHDEVLVPEHTVPLTLFISGKAKLTVELVVRKCAASDGKTLESPAEFDRIPVSYDGPPIDSITLQFTSPKYPCVYELDIESSGRSIAERQVVYFVQALT